MEIILSNKSPRWGDTRRHLATWLSIKPQLKFCRPLPIPSTFTMVAGHYSRCTEAGLLPRVNALAQPTFNMTEIRKSHATPSHENLQVRIPRQSWFIFILDLPAGWELWCSFLCISIHPTPTMTRKRGKTRRGSAWYTHKEQRQRR